MAISCSGVDRRKPPKRLGWVEVPEQLDKRQGQLISAPPLLKIILSAHAVERVVERGITEAEIISALTKPDSKTQRHRSKKTGGFVYLFTKEMAGRKLCVAADLYKDDCVVVTTYWI